MGLCLQISFIIYLECFCTDFSLPPCLLLYSTIYIIMDLIVWVNIQQYFAYSLAPMVPSLPLGAIPVGFCASLTPCVMCERVSSTSVLSGAIVKSLSHVRLFACGPPRLLRPWDFSRQEYWSGLPFPFPGDLQKVLILQAHLVYFLLQSYNQSFPSGALLPYIEEQYLESDWGTRYAHCYWDIFT